MVYKMIIDSGSCDNLVSEKAIIKLNIIKHPQPYKLAWLKKGSKVVVLKRCLVSFSVDIKL